MRMYTQDGRTVEVIKEIEEGYLGKIVYEDYSEDFEETEGPEYSMGEDTVFFDQLFAKPQTEAYALEIKQLAGQKLSLQNEISELQAQKYNEGQLLHKISQFPFIQALVQYVTGDFKYILYLSNYELFEKGRIYNGPYIKAMRTMNDGWSLYKLRNDNYSSNDDRPILCFNSLEDADVFVKKTLLEKIENWKATNYGIVSHFENWYSEIHFSQTMKHDPEVVSAYKAKLTELTNIQKQQQKEALDKQFQELDAKKKELEKLQSAQPTF